MSRGAPPAPAGLARAAAVAATLAVCLAIYLPAAHGPYLVDDYPNLVDNPSLLLEGWDLPSLGQAAFSSPSSNVGRPLAMLSFALNYTLAGDKDPYPVKLTNIALHLLTGAGLFLLALALARHWLPRDRGTAFWIALLTAAVWLVHPLHVSTVLYAVQRMAILSALFTVYGLVLYLRFRRDTLRGNRHYAPLLISLAGCTVLGVLSKENAALLPAFALLVEAATFRFAFHPRATPLRKGLLVAALAAPTAIVLLYLAARYLALRGVVIEPFYYTLDQRLLTEARVLMHYLGWILLVNPAPMSLFHSDFPLSTGVIEPATTLASLLVVATLGGFALWSLVRGRCLPAGFAAAWFLAGHLIESTTVPLELVFEHRNYLPSAGVLLAVSYALVAVLRGFSVPAVRRMIFCLLLVAVAAYNGHDRAADWGDDRRFVLRLIETKGHTPWAWSEASRLLAAAGDFPRAVESMRRAAALAPAEPAFVLGEASLWCVHHPRHAFPAELVRAPGGVFDDRRVTPVTVNTFAGLIRACSAAAGSPRALEGLYQAAARHDHDWIARLGRRALAGRAE